MYILCYLTGRRLTFRELRQLQNFRSTHYMRWRGAHEFRWLEVRAQLRFVDVRDRALSTTLWNFNAGQAAPVAASPQGRIFLMNTAAYARCRFADGGRAGFKTPWRDAGRIDTIQLRMLRASSPGVDEEARAGEAIITRAAPTSAATSARPRHRLRRAAGRRRADFQQTTMLLLLAARHVRLAIIDYAHAP